MTTEKELTALKTMVNTMIQSGLNSTNPYDRLITLQSCEAAGIDPKALLSESNEAPPAQHEDQLAKLIRLRDEASNADSTNNS
jgi:hypothetical protein